MRSIGNKGCSQGTTRTVKGYTSRAQKYHLFKKSWQEHEQYNKLKLAKNKLGIIGDKVLLPYPHLRVVKEGHRSYSFKDPYLFSDSSNEIDIDDFTVDFIHRVCKHRPQAMMGGTIPSYQKEAVPLFLAHLKETLPEKYKEFISEYAEYDKEIDHIGRTAVLKTVKPSVVIHKRDSGDEKWEWNGELLTLISGVSKVFVSIVRNFDYKNVVIKPSDDAVITISSNDQVGEDTVFID
ncbi:hypothetical protein ACQKKO_03500 [Alkalihalobacillus sp. NPDC127517]